MSISTMATSRRSIPPARSPRGRWWRSAPACRGVPARCSARRCCARRRRPASAVRPTRSSSELLSRSSMRCFSGGRSVTTRCRNSAVSSSSRSGDSDALHHDAARHGVKPGVFLGRQLPAGEHHDRHVGDRCRPRGSAPAPRSRSCPAAAGRAPRNRRRSRAGSTARPGRCRR